MNDRTIIAIPGVSQHELKNIKDYFELGDPAKPVFLNADVKVFKIQNDRVFEVVGSLKEVKDIQELLK